QSRVLASQLAMIVLPARFALSDLTTGTFLGRRWGGIMERTSKSNLWALIASLGGIALLAGSLPARAQPSPSCEIRVSERGRLNNGSSSDADLSASDSDGRLLLGRRVEFSAGTSISGAFVSLGNGARVSSVNATTLKLGRGAIVSGLKGPFTGGVPACEVPTLTCGGPSVTLKRGDAPRRLSPGTYGAVDMENGTSLILAPGEYTF